MVKQKKHLLQCLAFSFIGIGSLVWLCIRVIPKPSRAAYPCMRVAAPMASTFVLWLLGLGTSLLFLRRAKIFFRRNRNLTAVACLLIGGIASGILISMPHSPSFAALAPNTPIGVAKGAQPGRVVWVYDSTATNWAGLGDGHWWEGEHTRQAAVDQMMSRMLCELCGTATDSAAWDTLFRYFNNVKGRGAMGYATGEKIVIKTNFAFFNYYPDFCCVDSITYHINKIHDFMNTAPHVVRALLRQLVYVVGVAQADISIGDPTAYFPHEYYDSCHAEFPDVHYLDHAGKFNRTKAEFSDQPVYWSSRPAGMKQDYVPRQYAVASYLINLANMKSHVGAGVTLCAKNHYGSLIRLPFDTGYYDLHQSLAFMSPDMGSYRALVDIMGHKHLGGKTLLYCIDGLYAGNHNNDTVPHTWPVAPFNGGWTSSLFGSQDPVALESVLFDLFQLDDDPYQYPKIAGAQDYLVEAAQAENPPSGTFYDPNHSSPTERLQSLGVLEHWNNPTDRQYSRNLGTGNGIELIFVKGWDNHVRPAQPTARSVSAYHLRVLPMTSMVELSMPAKGNMRLMLYDSRGRVVGTVFEGLLPAGTRRFDVSSASGQTALPAGFYIFALYGTENNTTRLASKCTMELLQ